MLPETAISSGVLGPLPAGRWEGGTRRDAVYLCLAEPGSNQPHRYTTWCRHLSLDKLEDGVAAPSGSSYPIWGLLFRGPAVGQCPTW